jgi:hypothetical protein
MAAFGKQGEVRASVAIMPGGSKPSYIGDIIWVSQQCAAIFSRIRRFNLPERIARDRLLYARHDGRGRNRNRNRVFSKPSLAG